MFCLNFGEKINRSVVCWYCSLYSFDMRNLSRAACVHMDHVLSGMLSPVLPLCLFITENKYTCTMDPLDPEWGVHSCCKSWCSCHVHTSVHNAFVAPAAMLPCVAHNTAYSN